jgi:hypothetical protein
LDSESDDDEQVEIVRRPRVFRKRANFRFQYFIELNERFRLSSVKVEVLSNAFGNRLQHETQRNYALILIHCCFQNINFYQNYFFKSTV